MILVEISSKPTLYTQQTSIPREHSCSSRPLGLGVVLDAYLSEGRDRARFQANARITSAREGLRIVIQSVDFNFIREMYVNILLKYGV